MAGSEAITQVESNVYYMDPRKVGPYGVSGVYVIKAEEVTLIETGTSITVPYVLEAVREMGITDEDLKRSSSPISISITRAGPGGWLSGCPIFPFTSTKGEPSI